MNWIHNCVCWNIGPVILHLLKEGKSEAIVKSRTFMWWKWRFIIATTALWVKTKVSGLSLCFVSGCGWILWLMG